MEAEYVKRKTDFDMEPCIDSRQVCIWEWPNPMAEIEDKNTGQVVQVKCKEDAEAIVDSLIRMIGEIDPDWQGMEVK